MRNSFGDEQTDDFVIDEAGKLNRVAVDKLLRTREAIRRAHPDVVFEDAAELIREAREERSCQLAVEMMDIDVS